MKRKVREEYISLLRCALWGGDLPPVSHLSGVLRLAHSQKTEPLVADVLQRGAYPLPEKAAEELMKRLLATERLNTELDVEGKAILQEWAAEDISGIILKGQGLASYYLRPLLRVCGDIDLWVPEEDYDRACELLLKRERSLGDVRLVDEGDKHLCIKRGHVVIEVHRMALILPTKDILWQQIEQEGLSGPGTTPEENFNALFIFLHAWEHFCGDGVGLRQLCDWAMFLHWQTGKLDLALLRSRLEALQLLKPWQVFAALAVDGLGLPADEMPFYNARFRRRGLYILRMILKEGNFGKARPVKQKRSGRNTASKKMHTALSLPQRAIRLFPVFPGLSFRFLGRGLKKGFRKLFKGR